MEGENSLRERLARHDVEIEYLKDQISVLSDLREQVARLRAEIDELRDEIRMLRKEIGYRNSMYKWLVVSMISLASSFVAIAVAVLRVVP